MKNFIIATLIFIVVAICSIVMDAAGLYVVWSAMPNLLYYSFGWLAAGIYIAIKMRRSKA
jgi:Flp pilus assembly protein TadB